ncbi:MAG TPA: hypothetical protein PKI05_03655 [Thermogutta sp.]|nr:hypothetical protein [Thermogutta sp.]
MAVPQDRRQFLQQAGLIAAAGAAVSLEEKILLAGVQQEKTGEAEQSASNLAAEMPHGKVRNISISRLVIGGNLIGGFAHSRDLVYVSRLLKAYNTEEKVFETLSLAERHGINTIQCNPACLPMVEKYNKERGGKLQAIVCITPDADKDTVRREIDEVLSHGATMLYTHGGRSEPPVMSNRLDVLANTIECIKAAGVPAGIGSHSLTVTIECEKNGIGAEFYVKTLHSDQYWSATPKELREDFCWQKPRRDEPFAFHDNMWCLNPEETIEFMKSVSKPWFAFKILAAGAIHPRIGFPYALRNGADFVIVGMFDFQIAEDTAIFLESFKKLGRRERPWCA